MVLGKSVTGSRLSVEPCAASLRLAAPAAIPLQMLFQWRGVTGSGSDDDLARRIRIALTDAVSRVSADGRTGVMQVSCVQGCNVQDFMSCSRRVWGRAAASGTERPRDLSGLWSGKWIRPVPVSHDGRHHDNRLRGVLGLPLLHCAAAGAGCKPSRATCKACTAGRLAKLAKL
jgi:hypothetical protein